MIDGTQFGTLSSLSHFSYLLVVPQAIVMVLESKGDTAIDMMVKLLKAFWKTGLITVDQMNRVSHFVPRVIDIT